MKSYDIENTPELIDHIMGEQHPFTDDNISWQFNGSPYFAKAFKEKYPNFTKETYLKDAIEFFKEKGLTFKIKCFTENRNSKHSYLYSIEMYINDEWEWESETKHESSLFTYWVIEAIEDFDRLARKR